MGIAVTATRSSTTEPMLVGDACGDDELSLFARSTRRNGLTRGDAFVESSPLRAAELDDAGPQGAELPRPRACRWAVPADVLRRAAPRRDASASPAAAEFHRAVLRTGAADGSRVIELGVYLHQLAASLLGWLRLDPDSVDIGYKPS